MSAGVMSVTTTYPEFVSFVQKFLIEYNNAERSRTTDLKNDSKGGIEVPKLDKGEFVEYKLVCGHLFDRLITEYAISEAANDKSCDSNSQSVSGNHLYEDITGSENTRDVRVKEGDFSVVDKRISVVYMLVALNMAVRSNVNATAEDRVESLFKIAQIIANMKETTHHMIEGDAVGIQNEGITSSLSEVKTDGQGSSSIIQTEGDDNKNKDADSERYITVDSAQQVVDHLIHSWQVGHHDQSVYVYVYVFKF